MRNDLTLLEAYKAMYIYLDNYSFQMDHPNEIETLLSDLRLLADGKPGDPAAWTDWLQAVQKVFDFSDKEK